MLFGDDGVMQPYDAAEAQLQDQLGDLARGVYEVHALWDPDARPRSEQIMLCISQSNLFLVTLGSGRTLQVTESARSMFPPVAPSWSFTTMRWQTRRSFTGSYRSSRTGASMSKRTVEQVASAVEQAAAKRTDMRCWPFKDLTGAEIAEHRAEGHEAHAPGASRCTLILTFHDSQCMKEVPSCARVDRAVKTLNERIDQEGSFDRQ